MIILGQKLYACSVKEDEKQPAQLSAAKWTMNFMVHFDQWQDY